jgi:hemolysin activation/secretion protein
MDFPHAQNPKSKYNFYSARMGFGGPIKKNFLYAVKLHFIFTNANLPWQKPQTQTF